MKHDEVGIMCWETSWERNSKYVHQHNNEESVLSSLKLFKLKESIYVYPMKSLLIQLRTLKLCVYSTKSFFYKGKAFILFVYVENIVLSERMIRLHEPSVTGHYKTNVMQSLSLSYWADSNQEVHPTLPWHFQANGD